MLRKPDKIVGTVIVNHWFDIHVLGLTAAALLHILRNWISWHFLNLLSYPSVAWKSVMPKPLTM